MSAEPLERPGTRRIPSQREVSLLCPTTGFEADFRAIEARTATVIDLPARIDGRNFTIRLQPVPETIRNDRTRDGIRHFGDATWWEIDADGNPQGEPPRNCNGYVNLKVTAFDAVMGVMRTQF